MNGLTVDEMNQLNDLEGEIATDYNADDERTKVETFGMFGGEAAKLAREIETRFTHHPPSGDQLPRYTLLRLAAKGLARLIVRYAPPGRERELALTALDTVVMWANAAIARREA